MFTTREIAEMKAHEWGFPFDVALINRIEKLVLPYLSTIVQRRYDQTRRFPTSLVYTLKCIDLVVDDCNGINGIKLKRTKDKIPAPITTRDQSDFIYVGEPNFAKAFARTRVDTMALQKNRRFTSNFPFYFYDSGYIWVGNSNHLKLVDISFVPDNPLEVLTLQQSDSNCFGDAEIKIVQGSLLDGVLSLMDKNRPQLMTHDIKPEIEINDSKH